MITVRVAHGVATLYGSHSAAAPSTAQMPMIARLTILPRGKRFGISRNVRANCCMPMMAKQIDSGTATFASHGLSGHRYSKL